MELGFHAGEKGMRSLNGRTNRTTYWLCIGVVATFYAAIIMFAQKPPAIGEVVLLFVCVPRLHDIGMSGWWAGGAIIAELIVVAGSLLLLPFSEFPMVVGAFVLVIALAMIVLGLKAGDPGANRFGDPPPPGVGFGRKAQAAPVDKIFE
jgi:uncharacterized membrane protein YhaH (DUF805 family)